MTEPALPSPTIIVANARIATGNPARPWVTALAITGETLAALGSAAEILKLAGPTTQMLDAGGRTISLPHGASIGGTIHIESALDGDIVLHFSDKT